MSSLLVYHFLTGNLILGLPVLAHLQWRSYRKAVLLGGLGAAVVCTAIHLAYFTFFSDRYATEILAMAVARHVAHFVTYFLFSSVWGLIIGLAFRRGRQP